MQCCCDTGEALWDGRLLLTFCSCSSLVSSQTFATQMILKNYFAEGGAKAELVLPVSRKSRNHFLKMWGGHTSHPGKTSTAEQPGGAPGSVGSRTDDQNLKHPNAPHGLSTSDDLTALLTAEEDFF